MPTFGKHSSQPPPSKSANASPAAARRYGRIGWAIHSRSRSRSTRLTTLAPSSGISVSAIASVEQTTRSKPSSRVCRDTSTRLSTLLDGIRERADVFDLDADLVAGLEEDLWVAEDADAVGGAGGDQV